MSTSPEGHGSDRLAGRLRAEAVSRHGVPEDVAAEAARITFRRLGGSMDPLDTASARRAEAYFWGVVRRRALRGDPRTKQVLAGYVIAALAGDLAEAGHGPGRVFEEIEHRFGAKAAADAVSAIFPGAAATAASVAA